MWNMLARECLKWGIVGFQFDKEGNEAKTSIMTKEWEGLNEVLWVSIGELNWWQMGLIFIVGLSYCR